MPLDVSLPKKRHSSLITTSVRPSVPTPQALHSTA